MRNCVHCDALIGDAGRADALQLHFRECGPLLMGAPYFCNVTPSRIEQGTEISELLQSDVMVLNKPYYAVSSVWFSAFQAFVQGDGLHPGVLDNSPLANVNGEHVVVKPDILPDQYKFVSAQVWMRLVAWYGPAISIARSVVRLNTHYVLDMFPIDVRVDYLGFQFKLPLSRFNRMRMVRHWAATAVSITPHRAEIMIVESLPVNAVPVAGAREPRQLSDAQMSLSLHEMQFGDSVLLLLNAISNNFNFMLPPGNNHNYSIRQERDVVREREEVREMHGDGFQHMEVERHRDHPRDRARARMRMDHEFEEMGHFRMLAMADDNPRSPKRLLSSIARLQCCTFKSLENVDDQCLICMEAFNPDSIVRQLLCRHVFCEGCVLQWFGHSSCCPKCRADITKVLN